jgi:predicted  nucleic acid-binding Zn-ribbon protein
MDVQRPQDGKPKYKTPRWVQVWFFGRSRDGWKRKYQKVKENAKRLQDRVNDITKSRAHWREEAEQLSQRVEELEAQNAALQERAAASKKDRPGAGSRSGR